MNFSLTIPFIRVTFFNATEKHKKFFNAFFFNTTSNNKTFFNVNINILGSITTAEQYILENNCFSDNKSFFIFDTKKNKCKINFHSFTAENVEIEVEKDFDLYYLFTFLVEPLMIIWSAHHNLLFIHSSGVSKNNKITIFPAWRNTGKTNTILEFCQNGFDFCGDDFCLLYKQDIYLYPKSLNIFSYNLKAFPSVYAYLPELTFIRLKITSFIKNMLYSLSQLATGSFSKILFRISELAEVSTNIKVNPSQLEIQICEKGKLSAVTLLQKSSSKKTTTKIIHKNTAQEKIYQTIKYELKDFFELYSKYIYLFPNHSNIYIDSFDENYKKLVSNIKPEFKLKIVPKETI